MRTYPSFYPTAHYHDLDALFAERSSVILVSSPHDQGETAAATAGAIGFFKKKSFNVSAFISASNTLRPLHFLRENADITLLRPDTAPPLLDPAGLIIITLGIATPHELPSFVQILRTNELTVPLINIDRRGHNTGYGTINIVDEQASSISELVHKVLHAIDHHLIDAEIATALLTGMIIATSSFRAHNVRPETLALASELIEKGAEREKIIHHLYRSRSLSTLRLWGVALTRLKNNPSGLVTTIITRDDIAAVGMGGVEIHGVADELLANAPEAKAALLLFEDVSNAPTGLIHGLLSSDTHSCLELTEGLDARGHERRVVFSVRHTSAEAAERDLAPRITQQMTRSSADSK